MARPKSPKSEPELSPQRKRYSSVLVAIGIFGTAFALCKTILPQNKEQ
jgi:hypothetical protein